MKLPVISGTIGLGAFVLCLVSVWSSQPTGGATAPAGVPEALWLWMAASVVVVLSTIAEGVFWYGRLPTEANAEDDE